jgi:hypothetical protein
LTPVIFAKSVHYVKVIQFLPKLTKDGRSSEEFPVPSKNQREYDIRVA